MNKKKIKEVKFILEQHNKTEKEFMKYLDRDYGKENVVMALAEIYFDLKDK